MKAVFFGASLVAALLATAALVHCTSSAGITPMESPGAGDATLFDAGGGPPPKMVNTLGKPCSAPTDCSGTTQACCILPQNGTTKGVCTLRTACGPSGTGLGAGGKGPSSSAQLCGPMSPCLASVCSMESCESPKVSICSGSDFCSGGACTTDAECASGKCVGGVCAAGTCTSECPPGDPCTSNATCASGKCVNGVCAPPCTSRCPNGDPCTSGAQCASGVCTDGTCTAVCTSSCPAGDPCTSGSQCASGTCTDDKCVACTSDCLAGDACTSGSQCASGVCTDGYCAAPPCTSVCPDGSSCSSAAQCASGVCTAGKCVPPPCSPDCAVGGPCGANGDCKSGICTGGFCSDMCTPECTQGQPCASDGDCYSHICDSTTHLCAPSFCSPGCTATEPCGANTDCKFPNLCVKGVCTGPTSACGSCGKVTYYLGTFTCVELTDPCGNNFNCSCLLANQPCSVCPTACTPGASDQCEIDAGPQMCCPLGPGAGGFCAVKVTDKIDSGKFHTDIDAALVTSSCPATCDPCGGGGCNSGYSCCPLIRRNKHAGACVPGSVCPLPQCDPETCADQGFDCGEQTDGCEHPLNCGTCHSPEVCGGGGPPGVCAVPPDGPAVYDAGVDAGFCGN